MAIASVDSLTWALLNDAEPGLADGLWIVGHGPYVPSLPIIVRDPLDVGPARRAIEAAIAKAVMRDPLRSLRIGGFSRLTLDDYLPLLRLRN